MVIVIVVALGIKVSIHVLVLLGFVVVRVVAVVVAPSLVATVEALGGTEGVVVTELRLSAPVSAPAARARLRPPGARPICSYG